MHIVASFMFVLHVSLSMKINVYVDQDFIWREVTEVEPSEFFFQMHFLYSLNYF